MQRPRAACRAEGSLGVELHCLGLAKSYPTRNGTVCALADVTFSVAHREFVCLVGPSGCGKTTLLRLIAGLAAPTAGALRWREERQNGRPRQAMVFQEHGLFPWKNVTDNVAFGLQMQGVAREERRRRALAFIEQVGLAEFASHYPHELSVGMRQRVGIVRAFVSDPALLLMDEPLGALDAQTKQVLREELLRIWQHHQKMVVYVTHDIEEAVLLGDRILVMTGRPGRIRADIPIPLARPRHAALHAAEISEIRTQIWNMLEEEVRKSLCLEGATAGSGA